MVFLVFLQGLDYSLLYNLFWNTKTKKESCKHIN
jgi:hypothetical protein